ncbi:unnamed protein product [Symbiodinium pilosum]|uniref:Uncharacterized protein n=1 Tax=Symbiodinium pilosum TaxID=2952 RepID=A0A812TYD0_SYMPI|nr:unnamed protein product [Symbiodinium pilosum]
MSMVLAAFARLRLRDREMMLRVAEATPAILGQFSATDITHFLAAFSRLDVEHRLVFNLFAREIARPQGPKALECLDIGILIRQTGANAHVYAYARLNFHHDLLLDVLKKRIVEVVKAMKPWHLAMVANGFARLGASDERFFTILAAEIARKISHFESKPLALVANAYAKLGFLLELLGDEAFRRRGELEPQAVALVLNAHARLQMLYPRALATLLYSFSEVEIRHGMLFFNAPEHVEKFLESYTTDELCMVGRAYGRFQMAHTRLFESISSALPARALVGEAGCFGELGAWGV